MQKRFQIVNVWRLLGPRSVVSTPLSICDYRSLNLDEDIHASEVRGTAATISLYMISDNTQDAQRWHHLDQIRSDEIVILKISNNNLAVLSFMIDK